MGHLVHLQDCSEVLVAGDLHGHIGNFQTIMKAANLAQYPTRHLVLQEVIHSSFRYPKGGDKSHQLVDLFSALKCQYPTRVHLLPGNHEMAQMTGRPIAKGHESYNEMFIEGIRAAYGDAAPEINKAYNELFRALPLALRTINGVFMSHTLIPERYLAAFHLQQLQQETYQETDYQPGGVVYGLLWGRDTSEETAEEFLRKVDSDLLISGHIPTDDGYLLPNSRQVIVDCSASPSSYIVFPTDRPLTQADLIAGLVTF
jgi:hypothetical protein